MAGKLRKGCSSCLYSYENDNGDYYCGRKYRCPQVVDSSDWKKTKCDNWEYDGVSKGFDGIKKGEKI